MKKLNLKKITLHFFVIVILVVCLYISENYYTISEILNNNDPEVISTIASTNGATSNSGSKDYSQEKDNSGSDNNSNQNSKNGDKQTAQSSTSTSNPSGDDMVQLLARLINGEARGEPYEGQVAVGAVILNRVKSPEFPNTIAGVIYQDSQFSCVRDGQFDQPMEEGSTVMKAAQDAMNGSDPTNGALYFYNPAKAKSPWLFSLPVVKTIGKHKFAMGENSQ